MRVAPAAEVRAAIARWVLGDPDEDSALGEITLQPHQRDGLDRVRRLMEMHGGALLADDVGLGKTFIALAVARGCPRTVVVAPASLREMWNDAATRAGAGISFVSVESLGRRGSRPADAPFVIIDEAHALRSRNTRRFAAASSLCNRAKVLLLSATPIQNRIEDLRTMLSLFLGSRADAMDADDLARLVVRRIERDVPRTAGFFLPAVRPPAWVRIPDDVDCLERLVSLPPPLPPADGSDGGALLTFTLVRQWASSRAALRAALEKRLARARAMEDALLAGRLPSRAELRSWSYAEGAQQLGFVEILAECAATDPALLSQVQRHTDGVRALLRFIRGSQNPDEARARALRSLLSAHTGERVIAFSEYIDTVHALYRALAPAGWVAMLTSRGGRVAGGALTRRDLLERFSAGASARTPENERIDLLLTTDVLSEGVDLQDASVVVHLDLPWNPARLEQRVGRLRRVGAARDAVSVYVVAPPAPAERLLQLERRLRLKLGVASRALGVAGTILPEIARAPSLAAPPPREERITRTLLAWRGTPPDLSSPPLLAAVRAPRDGAIACVRTREGVALAVSGAGSMTDDRDTLDAVLGCAGGEDAVLDEAEADMAQRRVAEWMTQRSVADVVQMPLLHLARSRRALLHRVAAIARRTARHGQAHLAPLMRAARSAAVATLSAGAEQVLDQLAVAPLNDEAWLHALREFSLLHARPEPNTESELLALLILRRGVSGSRSR